MLLNRMSGFTMISPNRAPWGTTYVCGERGGRGERGRERKQYYLLLNQPAPAHAPKSANITKQLIVYQYAL
jgi:hypothetical protein